MANLFNSCFFDQFSNPSKYDIEIDYSDDPFCDTIFDEDAIFDLLNRTNVNVNKPADPDKIDNKLIKLPMV